MSHRAGSLLIQPPVMKRKSEVDRLAEAVRQAEAELDAAATLSDVKAAGKRLQRMRAALKAAEEEKTGGST